MHTANVELLQPMPTFSGVDEQALHLLLTPPRLRQVGTGDCVFREGGPAQCLYVLASGRATVLKRWQGHECAGCLAACAGADEPGPRDEPAPAHHRPDAVEAAMAVEALDAGASFHPL